MGERQLENLALLKELCEASGVPGREERLRAIVRRELEPLADEIRVDRLGNLIAIRHGRTEARLAINAHMDEIGFIVTCVDEGGFLRLNPLGGHDPRNMVSQRVLVQGKSDLPGLLYPGQKPPHLLTAEERDKPPKLTDFFVDVGLPESRVAELVPVGSPVVIQREFAQLGDGVCCKAMDDRVALFVMIEALRKARPSDFTVYAVATVQEEVGLRGAVTSSFGIDPDVGIALDVTIAADIPGVPRADRTTVWGGGTAIKIMDSSSISNPRLVEVLQQLASAREIPHQLEILRAGGTDAGALQRTRSGVPAGTISIPCRYVHSSVEFCHRADIAAAVDLMTAFVAEGHAHDYTPV